MALLAFAAAACQPGPWPSTKAPPRTHGWEAMAYLADGQPVRRASCTIRYKINLDAYPKRGAEIGIDVVSEIHAAAKELSALSGTRWVFDSYTHATWDGRGGTRSAAGWATTHGVVIELVRNPLVHWSQPNPTKGPRYTGGVIWLSMENFRRAMQHGDGPASVRSTIRHELAHQHGLGDLYDSVPHAHPVDVRMNNKMGWSRAPWGSGDREGFRVLRPRC